MVYLYFATTAVEAVDVTTEPATLPVQTIEQFQTELNLQSTTQQSSTNVILEPITEVATQETSAEAISRQLVTEQPTREPLISENVTNIILEGTTSLFETTTMEDVTATSTREADVLLATATPSGNVTNLLETTTMEDVTATLTREASTLQASMTPSENTTNAFETTTMEDVTATSAREADVSRATMTALEDLVTTFETTTITENVRATSAREVNTLQATMTERTSLEETTEATTQGTSTVETTTGSFITLKNAFLV